MIRVAPIPDDFTPLERYALALLLDGSGLLQVTDPSAPVVELVVTAGQGTPPGNWLETADGHVTLSRAMLSRIGAIAGAVTEQNTTAADRHGRVPSSVNAQVVAGAATEPTVDLLAAALRAAATQAAGNRPFALLSPWPGGHSWAAALTHDVDVISWWPLFTALRMAELGRRGKFGTLGTVAMEAFVRASPPPALAGIRAVCRQEERFGIRSTWFFLTGTPTLSRILAGDVTYRIEEPPAQEALRIALEAGGEIGLHGSFQTSELPDAFATERARLQRASGQAVNGVRQHFLRMRPGTTQERMDAAGFQYDATWGFADINGFRLGLALPAPAWNAMSASERALELVPLTWMDRVQSKYQGNEDPSSWIAQALELADTCRDAGGLWCGLWHPNLTAPLGFPGAPEAYARLCEQLAQRRPWFCTLTEAVSWRQRRRSARAVHVQDGGAVTLSAGSGEGLALRDAADRTVAFVLQGAA